MLLLNKTNLVFFYHSQITELKNLCHIFGMYKGVDI